MQTSLSIRAWVRRPLVLSITALLFVGLFACDSQPKHSYPGCCPVDDFRGCCSSEPVLAGGLNRGLACEEGIIPACAEYPIRERHVSACGDCGSCVVLYEAKSEESCNCTPLEDGCEPICVVAEAPTLPDACASVSPSFEGPAICPPVETAITYVASKVRVNSDTAAGFDLDGTVESSCLEGSQVGPDGPGGVDNSIAYADGDPLLFRDLAYLNDRIFEEVCYGRVSLAFEIHPNPEEKCATVSLLWSGELVTSSFLNLEGACLYGPLNRFVLPLPDQEVLLDNVLLTATLDETGFANMTLGATAGVYESELILESLDAVDAIHYFDIREDLDTTEERCDATSLTLDLAGATAVE